MIFFGSLTLMNKKSMSSGLNKSDHNVFEVLNVVAQALSSALRHKDLHTQLHSTRVINLSIEIGKQCLLSLPDLELLKISASLHDLGKIGIDDYILSKPGQLNHEEWSRMKGHAEIGAEIVADLDSSEESKKIAAAIRHHHENFAGDGYPARLKGEDIPYLSRIISIADCFDALTETRPYHKPSDKNNAIKIMVKEMQEEKFDPYLFNLFIQLMETA
jgi:HD-GYP domain-containing protein (c-di-GMP phosphodiesterase class II)